MRSIDVHAHGFPESFLRELAHVYPDRVILRDQGEGLIALWSKAPLPAFDVETRIAEMDRDGVGIEILSAPIIYQDLDDRTTSLCRHLNDFQAEMVRTAPDRFRSFIHLPVHHLEGCRAEIERWRGVPEVVGVVLGSNMGGIYPGEPAFAGLWELIAEHQLKVFIHPIGPCGVSMPVMSPIFMFPTDTAVAAASIIYSGLFERFPGLDIILAHYGGPLSVMAKRLDMAYQNPGFAPGHGQNLPRPPSEYLSRYYVDAAQGFHKPGFEAARAVFGLSHILFGSDHFLLNSSWRADLSSFMHSLDLTAEERHQVLRGNALQLFGDALGS